MQTRASPSVQTLHRYKLSLCLLVLKGNSNYDVKFGIRLAHQASIDGYEKMSKSSIFSKLQDQFNIDRLQRAEARRNKFSVIQENKKRKLEEKAKDSASREEEQVKLTPKKRVKLNTTDPIMFTPIDKKNSFKFCRPNGAVVRFNIASLVDFLLSTGDFTDPETRLPFSDDDLREIDDIVRRLPLSRLSEYVWLPTRSIVSGEAGESEEVLCPGRQEGRQSLQRRQVSP